MSGDRKVDKRLATVVSDVQIPLDNLAYTIEEYLLANGARLDTETRFLLAGIRDCADRVAGSVRRLAGDKLGRAGRDSAQPPAKCRRVALPAKPRSRSPA